MRLLEQRLHLLRIGVADRIGEADAVDARVDNRFDEPQYLGGLDATLASAEDYFVKLTRLETDGLPRYEERFLELLREQSDQNLTLLSHRLDQERSAIKARLELVNESLLKQVLRSPDFRARAAATRIIAAWRDRIGGPLELLQAQVNDEHPRVRLQAVWALSFFTGADAARASEIVVESLIHPQDDYLKFALDETVKTLDRRAKAAGGK